MRDDHFWVVESILDFRPKSFNSASSRKILEFKVAQENLRARDAQHLLEKNEANANEVTHFPIGSYVLAKKLHFFTKRKETDKLKPYLKGPFKVESHTDDYSKYTVRNLYEDSHLSC